MGRGDGDNEAIRLPAPIPQTLHGKGVQLHQHIKQYLIEYLDAEEYASEDYMIHIQRQGKNGPQQLKISLTRFEQWPQAFNIGAIDAYPKGSGLGTEVIWALRELADQQQKAFSISMITNDHFFNTTRFPFFREHYGDLVYEPSSPRA